MGSVGVVGRAYNHHGHIFRTLGIGSRRGHRYVDNDRVQRVGEASVMTM